MDTLTLPVQTSISRIAKPGREKNLVDWAESLCADASHFPGCLDTSVHIERDASEVAVTIGLRFSSAGDLLAWERSERRRARLMEGATLTHGEPFPADISGEHVCGSARPAPKWRTALSVWLALYPVAVIVATWVTPLLSGIPLPLSTAITSMATVATVIWLTLPAVHRGWSRIAGATRR